MAEIGCARVEEDKNQDRDSCEGCDVVTVDERCLHGEGKQREQSDQADDEHHRAVILEIIRTEYIEVGIETAVEDEHVEHLSGYRVVVLRDCSFAALVGNLLVCTEHCREAGGDDVTLVDDTFTLLYHAYGSHGLLICLIQQPLRCDGVQHDVGVKCLGQFRGRDCLTDITVVQHAVKILVGTECRQES